MLTRNCFYTFLAMFLLALTVACNHRQADYRLDYTVCPDTAGHYLNVCLTYETDSTLPHPTDVVLTMPRWAPGLRQAPDRLLRTGHPGRRTRLEEGGPEPLARGPA